MEQQVTVAIIEDHPVVTEGVASWIRSDPGQRVRLVQTARDLTGLDTGAPSAAVVILTWSWPASWSPRGSRGWWPPDTGWWPSPGTAIRRS